MRAGLAFTSYWLFLLLASWLAMQTIHECGHVLAAWASGGTVTNVVLHPLAFSRTDVRPNPHPLFVTWAGPLFGAIVPASLVMALRRRTPHALRFFAGFCLLANGLYLAVGSLDRVGDTGDLLGHGAPMWGVVGVGVTLVVAGLYVWHRLDWRSAHSKWTRRAVYLMLTLLLVLGLYIGK